MRLQLRHLSFFLAAIPFAVSAAPSAGTAQDFAVVAGSAVTCTDGSITGGVGVVSPLAVTQTGCAITGGVHTGDAAAVRAYADFLSRYRALATTSCDHTLPGSLAGLKLPPGVYCVDAASTTTDGTLTLVGPANGTWLFKVGTMGTGALTGTNFNVVTAGGARACNVTWRVAEAVTMTTSHFQGTVLAGASVTVTGGTFNGDVFAGGAGTTQLPSGAVTLSGTTLAGCAGTAPVSNPPKPKPHEEGCERGDSDHGYPAHSDDERDGGRGHSGRKGENGK